VTASDAEARLSPAKVPYPGMPFDQLIAALQNGYRKEKPELMPQDIRRLVANDCWKQDSRHRPTFSQLSDALAARLTLKIYCIQENWLMNL